MITTNLQTPSEDEPHGGGGENRDDRASGTTSGGGPADGAALTPAGPSGPEDPAGGTETPPGAEPPGRAEKSPGDVETAPGGVGTAARPGPYRVGPGHRTLDDDALVRRAQQGDLQAFEELVRRHQATMYRLAYRILGDQGRAEDAVQDSFVSVWRRIGSFRSDAKFTSWLYRIVTNRCLNVARSHKPTTPLDEGGARLEARGGDGPERSALRQEQLEALRAAVAALPPSQRACWLLREQEGLGYEEIAAAVGSSPVAVRGRIHRARTTIAEAMQPWR